MSCSACNMAPDDGRLCRYCGSARPHAGQVATARAIAREAGADIAVLIRERDASKAAIEVAKGALTIASVSDDPAATRDACGVCGEPPDFCDRTAAHYGEATACVGHVARAALSRISTLVDPPGGKR